MSKQFFKRLLPSFTMVKAHPKLQFFGELLHDPNLWHLNRRSLAGGMAVGLFVAFIPVPMQMIIAAAVAIYFRVNLPLSVSLVWLSNPITMPPLFYITYKIGTLLLNIPVDPSLAFSLSSDWFLSTLSRIWQPFLLGSLIVATFCSLTGYLIVSLMWRLQVGRLWRERREKRLLARQRCKLGNLQ
ncbi:MAG: ATP-binding protein [Beggiatoa sp. IS2]|nr:MAG: ATP-binding protein [Beggiatoa sp. IS2]